MGKIEYVGLGRLNMFDGVNLGYLVYKNARICINI